MKARAVTSPSLVRIAVMRPSRRLTSPVRPACSGLSVITRAFASAQISWATSDAKRGKKRLSGVPGPCARATRSK